MVIKEILEQLKTAHHPIAKAIHKGEHFKVLALGFNAGMVLKEHVAHQPAVLTVLSGTVTYHQQGVDTLLHQYEEQQIPVNIPHSVTALEDSLCLLTQG